jgi:hypothetical protein
MSLAVEPGKLMSAIRQCVLSGALNDGGNGGRRD